MQRVTDTFAEMIARNLDRAEKMGFYSDRSINNQHDMQIECQVR